MKRAFTAAALLVLLVGGCSGSESTPSAVTAKPGKPAAAVPPPAPVGFQSVSPREVKQLIDTRQDLLLLDVRSPQELRQGAIAGSQLFPFWAVMQGKLEVPPEQAILLICAVGGRSYAAGQALVKRGYREVYNLSGGISAWKKAGLPLVY